MRAVRIAILGTSPCRARKTKWKQTTRAQAARSAVAPQKGAAEARPKKLAKEDILQFIHSSPGNIGRREIARAFGIKGADRIDLKRILKELAADGLIADSRRRMRKEALPQVGVIVVRSQDRNGDLIATPLHWNEEDGAPPRILLDITRRYEGPAIGVGDHVLARLREAVDEADGEEKFGFVASPIKRLPRQKARQLGILRKAGRGFIVESIDKKDLKDWPVCGRRHGRSRRRRARPLRDAAGCEDRPARRAGHGAHRASAGGKVGQPDRDPQSWAARPLRRGCAWRA